MARNVRGSPRKAGLVADVIRGKSVTEALALLRFLPQRAAKEYAKVVKSAAANAETNFNLDPGDLYVIRATADKGMTLKRFRPKARGRVGPILKRSSHLTVVVAERG
jgi:large subunit ribosomal protein L22